MATHIETRVGDVTNRFHKYSNSLYSRRRNDDNGKYSIYSQHQSTDMQLSLKKVHGINGDLKNIGASFKIKIPLAKNSNFNSKTLSETFNSMFKAYDNTCVLSKFVVDKPDLTISLIISWLNNDVDAEVKADRMVQKVKSASELSTLLNSLPTPFNGGVLSADLEPLTVETNVQGTIHTVVSTYNGTDNKTVIKVNTVGLYDHIGVKINNEDDNSYRRLRTTDTVDINGINPITDIIIVTLFSKDYKKLYTIIQTSANYVQQTSGSSGDLYNVVVDGSMKLEISRDVFVANNLNDFITTMNLATGGFTVVVAVREGSAIVDYKVVFESSTESNVVDTMVAKLSSAEGLTEILSASETLTSVVAVVTPGVVIGKKEELGAPSRIVKISFDNVNLKINIKTVGPYDKIAYRVPGAANYILTKGTSLVLPPGFTNKVDVKLVGVNGDELSEPIIYSFDRSAPYITLIGGANVILDYGGTYTELGSTVVDDSGEPLIAVITGAVGTSPGSYTLTYTSTDSSNNTSSVNRRITIANIYQEFPGYENFTGSRDPVMYQNLLNNTESLTFIGDNLYNSSLYFQPENSYKFSRSCVFKYERQEAIMFFIEKLNGHYSVFCIRFTRSTSEATVNTPDGYATEGDSTGRLIHSSHTGTYLYMLDTYDAATRRYELRISTSKNILDEVYHVVWIGDFFSTYGSPPIANSSELRRFYVGCSAYEINYTFIGSVKDIKISREIMTWDIAHPP